MPNRPSPSGLPFALLCRSALLLCAACAQSSGAAPTARAPAPAADAEAEALASPPAAPPPAARTPLLDFLGIGRGDRIADLGAGKGYSSAELAEAVGPFGIVYVRHGPRVLSALPSTGAPQQEERPSNVIHMATPIGAPFLPEARSLSCVTFLFGYHELIAEDGDRSSFNRAVFAALQPGGLYIVAEHAAAAGSGPSMAKAEQRIEPGVVRAEVEAAGFHFVEAAEFLSTTLEARASAAGEPARSSQYLLKFQKPAAR